MRLIGLMLLILAGGGYGCYGAVRLKKRVIVLETAVRWAQHLQTEFRFHRTPLSKALEVCACQPAFRELTFLATAGTCPMAPTEGLITALRQQTRTLALMPADVELLTQLCAGLGTTDLEGQLRHLELYAARLAQQQTEAREQYRCKGKVYRVLGVGVSAAMALVLW